MTELHQLFDYHGDRTGTPHKPVPIARIGKILAQIKAECSTDEAWREWVRINTCWISVRTADSYIEYRNY